MFILWSFHSSGINKYQVHKSLLSIKLLVKIIHFAILKGFKNTYKNNSHENVNIADMATCKLACIIVLDFIRKLQIMWNIYKSNYDISCKKNSYA